MPPQEAAYNVDWVVSNSSNVHVATDRAWFTSYTPYRTKVRPMPGAEPSVEIYGIGTVVLPTRTYREGKAHKPSGELILRHVLHAPHSHANIFAMSREPDLNIPLSPDVESITRGGSSKVIGLIVPLKAWKLWLKGQPQKQSVLDSDAMYYIHATWPEEEIAKYNRFITESKAENASKPNHDASLTAEEKEFLKKHYGNEFKFLMSYGLSIHKEEDREEGRSILRALMSKSDDEAAPLEDSDDDQSVESNDFLAEIERDPTSHVADYKFSAEQLDFIKARYGHSGNFMLSCGLKPFDDDDCDEAVSIIKTFMSERVGT
ncbi:hypothetical protein KCU73_g4264, partial [Aureobasidium melanogenum]